MFLLPRPLFRWLWDLQAFMIPVYGTEIGLDAVQNRLAAECFFHFDFCRQDSYADYFQGI